MEVAVSVCIPAYRATDTLHLAVAAALDQDLGSAHEVLVCVSADSDAELGAYPPLPEDLRLHVITHVPRLSASDARQRCIDVARGTLLAFTDADAIARRDWLRQLCAASQQGSRIVGGSIANGTPQSRSGTAEYLVEFSSLAPERPARDVWHGALCNLLIPRALWGRYGPFPALSGGGEDTVITGRARERGEFVFCADAGVTHLNRTRPWVVVRHQYQLGRYAAHIARVGPCRARSLMIRPWLAPMAAVGRVVAVYGRTMASPPGERLRALTLSPMIVVMLGAWGAGLFVQGRRLDRGAPARVNPSAGLRSGPGRTGPRAGRSADPG